MLVHVFLLMAGFILLVSGANWLVNGSVSLAKRYRIPELVIGLTIVAFGTSSPELLVNIQSSISSHNDVALGNIIGSNIFNLLLILGISGLIYPLTVQFKSVWKEIPFSLLAAVLMLVLANDFWVSGNMKSLGPGDGVIMLLFFMGFMIYIFRNMKEEQEILDADYKSYKIFLTVIFIIGGLLALVAGSKLVVDHAVILAKSIGVSEKLIGLTIISAGTSLPELVTSVVAATKKRSDIAIGNVIGSNIFNIFFILGISAVIRPIQYSVRFNFDLIVLILGTVFLFITMFSGKKYKLDRWEAALLFIIYIWYITFLIRTD